MIMQEMSVEPKVASRAEKIRNAAERCSRIVKTFLSMARNRTPPRGAVNINEIIDSALELAAYGLRSSGVDVFKDLAPDLPEVWGDEDQLHQVMANLIVNAQQATKLAEGPRRLRLRSAYDATTRQVVIEVVDTGPGIDPEISERIFEPFFTTKPEGAGTGIGLAVCKDIVSAHGGEINFVSDPEHGTTFRVTVPVGRGSPRIEPVSAEAPDRVSGGSILVVDDEPDISQTLADILRGHGHSVQTADGGAEALEQVAARSFDLIFCDVRMPMMDGPAFLEALQTQYPTMARRLVFVTGDTLGTDVPRLQKETGAPVLEKPFDPELVIRLIAERLSAKPRDRSGASAF